MVATTCDQSSFVPSGISLKFAYAEVPARASAVGVYAKDGDMFLLLKPQSGTSRMSSGEMCALNVRRIGWPEWSRGKLQW